ncbi:MAG: DNA methyltransferase [Candidatus Saccharimonadaceae bacterium]|nr:DNA methyltransferase [Candidatus Saccharimonadaceae bacterium]
MMETNKILLGNNLDLLRLMPSNSVDSVVTDPPYGINFMNKKWDYDVPSVGTWKEVLRVLKPGGHILCACGTRTQHRMACNIEDAGFEIRDIVAWIYGCLSEDTEILTINGWERFHKDIVNSSVLCYNVSEDSFAFHKPKRSFNYENEHTAYRIQSDFTDQIVSSNHRVLVERGGRKVFVKAETLEQQENIPILESLFDLPKAIYDNESHTSITKQDLLSRVYKQDIFEKTEKKNKLFNRSNLSNMRKIIFNHKKKTRKVLFQSVLWESKRLVKKIFSKRQRETTSWNRFERGKESSLERRSNLFQKTRELFTNKICKMSERLFGNGSQRRLCYGTSLNNGTIIEKIVIENGSNPPYKSQSARQSNRKSYAIQNKSSAQKIRRTRAIVTPIEYKGNVWCVEVETGAFVARRNGKIFITGNSGFPKSLDISKAIDRAKGAEREITRQASEEYRADGNTPFDMRSSSSREKRDIPSTPEAQQWQGWGTALKPSAEYWTIARKPLESRSVLWYNDCIKGVSKCLLQSFANAVEKSSKLNQQDQSAESNIVQWIAEKEINTSEDLFALMDTLQSYTKANTNLNIVLSWLNTLAEIWKVLNTSTIKTEINLTTELRILKSTEWENILANITLANNNQTDGLSANVCDVVSIFSVLKLKLKDTHLLIVQENASSVQLDPNVNMELWTLARKPLVGTVAENVLRYGTGGINIDGCRVETEDEVGRDNKTGPYTSGITMHKSDTPPRNSVGLYTGRFPANVIHDGSDEVVKLFPQSGNGTFKQGSERKAAPENLYQLGFTKSAFTQDCPDNYGDIGSAARFFYTAKAQRGERDMGLYEMEETSDGAKGNGLDRVCEFCGVSQLTPDLCLCKTKSWVTKAKRNIHPTVKPLDLMRYLVRLITPKGGIVLDPYLGSGTTAVAAKLEGMQYIGMEREPQYVLIAEGRVKECESDYETKAKIYEDKTVSKVYDIFDYLTESPKRGEEKE